MQNHNQPMESFLSQCKEDKMKNSFLYVFAALLLPLFITAQKNPDNVIGMVEQTEGKVYLQKISAADKVLLKKGDSISEGVVIQTDARSSVLIKLNNGILKYIPALTRTEILSRNLLERYKKSEDSFKSLHTMLGSKAKDNDVWVEDEKELLKQLKADFEAGRYLDVIKQASNKVIDRKNPEAQFLFALAYFKLGNSEESIRYFSKVTELKAYEFEEKAWFGLLLNYYRLDNKDKIEEVKKILKQNYPESSYHQEIKKLKGEE